MISKTFFSVLCGFLLLNSVSSYAHDHHTITITDNIENKGWIIEITKTYYNDDITNWVSKIFKNKGESIDGTVSSTVLLNCVNLGFKETPTVLPTITILLKEPLKDNSRVSSLKFVAGDVSVVETFQKITPQKLVLSNAKDLVNILRKENKHDLTIYFNENDYDYSTYDLTGLRRFIPDFIECSQD